MSSQKSKNQLNIYKEFWQLATQAEHLASTDNYDVDMLIEAWKHQLIYVQLGRGYSKELFDPHWCYILKHCGTKFLVIPVTSLKVSSGAATIPYEYDILEYNNITGRMHFDDIRCIDKMRIIERKGYISVLTERREIENAYIQFLNFSSMEITDKS